MAAPLARLFGGWRHALGNGNRRRFQKRILPVIGKKLLDGFAQRRIRPTDPIQERGAFCWRRFLNRLEEEVTRLRSR